MEQENTLPEIWSYGWRNPWRFSFDKETGDLWAGDVGQGSYEEISFQASGQGGSNYGWRIMEGLIATNLKTAPKILLSNLFLNTVIAKAPLLQVVIAIVAIYYLAYKANTLFGDFASGRLWIGQENNGPWQSSEVLDTHYNISSFGEDANGELYLLDYKGVVYL